MKLKPVWGAILEGKPLKPSEREAFYRAKDLRKVLEKVSPRFKPVGTEQRAKDIVFGYNLLRKELLSMLEDKEKVKP